MINDLVVRFFKKSGIKGIMTDYISKIAWSGQDTQVSRTCSIELLNAPNDPYVRENFLVLGDSISLETGDGEFFRGEITNIVKSDSTSTVSYECKDLMHHLMRSTACYNFKKKTPEYITRKVCADAGIKVGILPSVNVTIPKIIADDWSLYKVIMHTWYKTFIQTGKRYELCIKNQRLTVFEKGTAINNYYLSRETNLTACEITETSDNVVNQVVIYDDKNKKIGIVSDEKSIKKYGLYQSTYKKEDKIDSKKAAKRLLEGIEQTITVSVADLPVDCISGMGIKVYDKKVGMYGMYWIESDTHTWENGVATGELTLKFKNIMDTGE